MKSSGQAKVVQLASLFRLLGGQKQLFRPSPAGNTV